MVFTKKDFPFFNHINHCCFGKSVSQKRLNTRLLCNRMNNIVTISFSPWVVNRLAASIYSAFINVLISIQWPKLRFILPKPFTICSLKFFFVTILAIKLVTDLD